MKLKNTYFANMKVSIEGSLVEFDAEGIAEVQPDEVAQKLLANPRTKYVKVEEVQDEGNGEQNPDDIDPNILKPDEFVEVKANAEGELNLDKMTGKELDKLAEELEVPDYPSSANVGTRRAAIGAFLASKSE